MQLCSESEGPGRNTDLCTKILNHDGLHSWQEARPGKDCDERSEGGEGLLYCVMPEGHVGPHSWELGEPSVEDVSLNSADPYTIIMRLDIDGFVYEGEADDIMDHAVVLQEALNIYIKRNRNYRGAWQRYGALDSAMHLRSKGLRAFQRVMSWIKDGLPADPDLDDGIDFVNYAAFFVRNARAGRLGDE